MTKNIKIGLIGLVSLVLFVYWIVLFVTKTQMTTANYWWQAILAALSIMAGIFGVFTAKKWSWLKSGVGKGVFFVSLGLLMWGLGQAGWAYYTLAYPDQEVVYNKLVDVLYFSSIPLWAYGIWCLSKATGAKYGLKGIASKIVVIITSVIVAAVSYYFLIIVARGGSSYFDGQTIWNAFFDLAYAFGDAINLILALVIFGLSWKFLGGRFKRPIVAILSAFGLIYLADFFFSYYDGKGQYYNGHWSDLLYLSMVAVMGVGICMLDPSKEASILKKMFARTSSNIEPTIQPAPINNQEGPKQVSSTDENLINQGQPGGVATSPINNQQGGEQ
jgi:hypothetical protein